MSYEVQVPKPVEEKIASWRLPHALLTEVYRRLTEELAAQPTKHLLDIVAPIRAMQYLKFERRSKGSACECMTDQMITS